MVRFFYSFLLLVILLLSLNKAKCNSNDEVEKTKNLIKELFTGDVEDSVAVFLSGKLLEYFSYSNPEEGLAFYNEILKIPNALNSNFKKALIYGSLAQLYKNMQNIEFSAKYIYLAIDALKKTKEEINLGWFYISLGNLLFSYNQFTEAMKLYHKSYNLFQEYLQKKELSPLVRLNFEHGRAVSTENIGLCFQKMGNFDSAFFYVKKAENFRLKTTLNKLHQQYYYHLIGNIYFDLRKYDSAIYYSKLSYYFDEKQFIPKLDYPEYVKFRSQAELTTGMAYLSINKKDSGFFYLKKSIQTIKNVQNQPLIVNHHFIISKFLYDKGFSKDALKYIDEALTIINKNPNIKHLAIDFYSLAAQIYTQLGQHKKSNILRGLVVPYLDSVIKKTLAKNIKNAELDVELHNKIQALEVLNIEKNYKEQQLKSQRTITLLLVIVAIILIIFSILIYHYYRKKKQIAKELEEKNHQLTDLNKKLKNALILTEKLNFDLESSQKKLIKTNDELESINKTKNILFSVIAHDLKNSFGGIKNTNLFLLEQNANLSEPQRFEVLMIMKETLDSLSMLLENLLLWSASQSKRITPQKMVNNPCEIVNAVIRLLSDLAKKKKVVINNLIPQELYFSFDAALFQIIMQNLLHNSIKYSNEEGEITVTCTKEQNEISFCVSDNGVGMTKEQINKLFKDIRTESSYGTKGEKGTGLGLSIVKDFVELHNGKIWVESEVGFGTRVNFTFELINEQ
ncbi:MAG: ATP-binding protein [Ignavibacteria bacterium]|nr:ATP-binding protein [Ignavibacteria bacterium]